MATLERQLPDTYVPPRNARTRRLLRWRASEETLRVAVIWAASRVSVFVLATYSTWVLAGDPLIHSAAASDSVPLLGPIATWNRFDLPWYTSIETLGYGAQGWENNFAFLPGFPALLWVFGKLNAHPALAGLIISAVAGFIAAIALARLTRQRGGRGDLAVLVWVLAPAAVFLAAPYTEAVFCAFAFWAWLRAEEGHWLQACLLAAGASLIRVNGLFLAVALGVLFLTSASRRWRDAPFLLLPVAAVAAVLVWFHSMTGSWTTWTDAQTAGWGRTFVNPVDALTATINGAFFQGQTATYNIQYKLELASMLVLVVVGVVLLVKRWWGEATYVLLTAAALGTSSVFLSVPRTLLVVFPIWVLLGVWMSRQRWVLVGYVMLAAPLMAVGVMGFVNGRWIA